MFLDRQRRAEPGRFLHLKVGLFFVGAAVLLAGMVTERDVVVAVAIAILAVGFLLRFLERRDPPRFVEDDDDPEDEEPLDDRGLPPDVPEDRRQY
jgi:hypothetical protein